MAKTSSEHNVTCIVIGQTGPNVVAGHITTTQFLLSPQDSEDHIGLMEKIGKEINNL
jgi:hypothetical protein